MECTSVFKACMIRATRLTPGGAPRTGAKQGVASNIMKRIAVDPIIETGTSITEKNACGDVLLSSEDPDKQKGKTVTLDILKWDFELLQIFMGGRVYYDSADAVGWDEPAFTDDPPDPICLEFWSKAWDGDAHAVVSQTDPDLTYHHQVVPFIRFTPRPYTLSDGSTVYQMSGKGTSNPNITVNGPFNDWPDYIVAQEGVKGPWADWYDTLLPTHACGAISVPSGS